MTFPDTCQKCNEDPAFLTSWDRTMDMAGGKVHHDSLDGIVEEGAELRRVYRKRCECLNKDQFKERFGYEPSAFGVKPCDILDHRGQRRSVYVLEKSAEEGFELSLERVESDAKGSYSFKGQALLHDTLDNFYQRGQKDFEEKAHKAIYTKAVTEEALDERIKQRKANQPLAALVARHAAGSGSDSEASEGDAPGEDELERRDDSNIADEEGGGGPASASAPVAAQPSPTKQTIPAQPGPRRTTPSKSPAKSSFTQSLFGGGGGSAASVGRTSAGDMSDDEVDTGEPAKTAVDHIKKLNIIGILSNKKKGQQRRNAEEFVKGHPDAPDIDLLREKVDLARGATAFHRGGIDMLDSRVVQETCKLIKEHHVLVPSVANEFILNRAVSDWQQSSDKYTKMDDIISLTLPWHEGSQGGDDQEGEEDTTYLLFDPTLPKVAALDASDIETATLFGDILVKKVLAPMLKQEAGALPMVVQYASKAVSRLLEVSPDSAEAIGEVTSELLVCFRGLLVMVFAEDVVGGTHEDFEELTTPPKSYKLALSLNASLKALG